MQVGPRQIGVVLFDDVEELDVVGPREVLAWWTQGHPEDGFAVTTLSPDGGPVRCAKSLRIGADHAWDDAPTLDVVVYPGGRGTRPLQLDEQHLAWVRSLAADASLMTSVCTGSLVYAAAGLLAGRPATTHWGALERLAAADPTVDVRPDERFVDDGEVITAAGVSAGIDLALHLVARLASPDRARAVRRGIQYDPQPPVSCRASEVLGCMPESGVLLPRRRRSRVAVFYSRRRQRRQERSWPGRRQEIFDAGH